MIKNNYIVLLIFLIVIIISSQIIIRVDITRQNSDAETINIAGKQSMSSQQITKIALYANEVRNSPFYDKDIATLEKVLDTFRSRQNYLIEKNKIQYLKTGITSLFKKNDPYFKKLVISSENLVKNPNSKAAFDNFIFTVKSNEASFLRTMDAIVNEYQKISEDRLALLKKVQLFFITFTSVVLLTLLLFMFLPLFRKNKALISMNLKLLKFKNEVENKEREKKNIENILNRIGEVAKIGTWEVNFKENRVFMSKVTREIYGIAQDFEIPNMDYAIKFYKKGFSRDKIKEVINHSIKNKTPYDAELELVTEQGKCIWIRTIGEPEYKDGKCVRMYGAFQDINSVKIAEIKLKKVNEELNAIFNTGPISIIRTDTTGKITYFNKGSETLLGYKSEEVVNIHTPVIFHKKEEIITRGKELSKNLNTEIKGFDVFTSISKNQKHEVKKWTYVAKNGKPFPVKLIITAIKNNNQEIIAYLCVATDISLEVDRETKLIKTNDDLEIVSQQLIQQNQQLANFAHIASHNLRAPISNLTSLIGLYDLSETKKEKKVIFDKFKTVISHLSSTLDTLVEAIKTKQKKETDLKLEEIYFQEKVNKVTEFLIADINKSGAIITTNFSEAEKINYNESYLESILINLVSNALRYKSPERKIEITLRTRIKNRSIQLLVSDNGLGINLKKNGHKIFGLNKVFHRHPDSKGVGLYIIKNQIESLGGNISCVSKVNKGSTFIVTFKAN